MALQRGLVAGAKFSKKQIGGHGRSTWTKRFESGVVVPSNGVLYHTAYDRAGKRRLIHPDEVESITISANADGVRGSGKRGARRLPQIPPGSANAGPGHAELRQQQCRPRQCGQPNRWARPSDGSKLRRPRGKPWPRCERRMTMADTAPIRDPAWAFAETMCGGCRSSGYRVQRGRLRSEDAVPADIHMIPHSEEVPNVGDLLCHLARGD